MDGEAEPAIGSVLLRRKKVTIDGRSMELTVVLRMPTDATFRERNTVYSDISRQMLDNLDTKVDLREFERNYLEGERETRLQETRRDREVDERKRKRRGRSDTDTDTDSSDTADTDTDDDRERWRRRRYGSDTDTTYSSDPDDERGRYDSDSDSDSSNVVVDNCCGCGRRRGH